MMMAATRRSFRARKTSPKSKKRSRKNHHEHRDHHDHHNHHDSEQQYRSLEYHLDPRDSHHHRDHSDLRNQHDSDQQYRSLDYHHLDPEEARDKSSDPGRKSRASSTPPGVSSRHGGDVGDSGIDSGNGHVEPESLQTRLGPSSLHNHVNVHQTQDDKYSSSSSSKRQQHRAPEASATSSDNSPMREPCEEMSASMTDLQAQNSDGTKSKHRRRKSSGTGGNLQKNSPEKKKPTVVNHAREELSSADNASEPETKPQTDNRLSTQVSEHSETSSMSSNYAEQQLRAKEEKKVVIGRESKLKDEAAKERQESSESEGETSDLNSHDRQQLDAMSMTSDRRKRKRKLQARLDQARQSLATPHIDAAVEAIESSEETPEVPQAMTLLQEFRRLFQQELIRLRLEMDTFRHFCSKQMESEAESVFSRHRDRKTEDDDTRTEETAEERHDCCTQTKETEGQQESEGTKTKKTAEELEDLEEKLTTRQTDLMDYEKEILEVETMLNQRQAICERRQSALLALDEELQSLREDIFNKKENLKSDSDTNVERARKNWDLVRRHLTDKQAMLEAAVQRYRTQIASSNAALGAKDTLVAHLQKQLRETHETLKAKEKKVNHLENKLVLATEEMHVLNNSRQNSGPHPPDSTNPDPDPLSRSQSRRASLRPGSSLMQRQRSESSDRGGLTGRGSSVRSSTSDPQRDSAILERNSGHRAVSAPATERRKSTVHAPDSVLVRGKSSANLSRTLSARERRIQHRRGSTSVAAAGGGGGGGKADANSAACVIL
ncbi:hypothetical protein ACOMHN_019701 [Nucella lapillus]